MHIRVRATWQSRQRWQNLRCPEYGRPSRYSHFKFSQVGSHLEILVLMPGTNIRTTAYSFRFTSLDRDDDIDAKRCGTKTRSLCIRRFLRTVFHATPRDLTPLLTFITVIMCETLTRPRFGISTRYRDGKRISLRPLLLQIKNYITTELSLSTSSLYLDQMTNLNFSRK